MFSRPKVLFLISLLFVALFNPYLPFEFLIFIILIINTITVKHVQVIS